MIKAIDKIMVDSILKKGGLIEVIYLKKNILKIVFVFILFTILAISSLSEAVDRTEQVLAIKNAHIYPVTRNEIPSGILLVKGKKIVAVGADVSIPADARVIDAQGKHIIPGIVESHFTHGAKTALERCCHSF